MLENLRTPDAQARSGIIDNFGEMAHSRTVTPQTGSCGNRPVFRESKFNGSEHTECLYERLVQSALEFTPHPHNVILQRDPSHAGTNRYSVLVVLQQQVHT